MSETKLTNQCVESLQEINMALTQEAQGFIRQLYRNKTHNEIKM